MRKKLGPLSPTSFNPVIASQTSDSEEHSVSIGVPTVQILALPPALANLIFWIVKWLLGLLQSPILGLKAFLLFSCIEAVIGLLQNRWLERGVEPEAEIPLRQM